MPQRENQPIAETASTPHPGTTAIFWLLGSILVFAPLFRSGQPAFAVLVLELLAVVLLAVILWQPRWEFITRTEAVALTLLFVLPLLYLIPLPAGLVAYLPGRELYLTARALLADAQGGGFLPLSLAPLETESALLFMVLPTAVFIGAKALDSSRALRLIRLLLAVAALQALLGILQYGASEGSPLFFGMELPAFPSAKGTYTNGNHLAGLLEMLLPIAFALVVYSIGRGHTAAKEQGWKQRILFFASTQGHTAFVYGAVTLLLLLGIVFTRSRAGIALGVLALLLSTLIFARRIGGDNAYGPIGTAVTLAAGTGIAVGMVLILDRFSAAAAIEDERWSIFSATLEGIGTFFPVGSGPGNYPQVFPVFHPLELGRWIINHAHNDYLEWLFEGGLLAAALMLLLLGLYARQWTRVWTRNPWSRSRFVQIAAGVGLLLLLLHGLLDYNLHITANITYFAFLAGVFFSKPEEPFKKSGRYRRRRTQRMEEPHPASAAQSATATRLDNPDERAQTQAIRAWEPAPNGDLKRIRETITELTQRIPKLFLLQPSETSEQESAPKMRALGNRLTAYIQAVEQDLERIGKSRRRPRDTGPENRSDDLDGLRLNLEAMLTTVDAFIQHPEYDAGYLNLDARLQDAEQQHQTNADEQQQEQPAATPTGVPLDIYTRLYRRDTTEHRQPQDPGASETKDRALTAPTEQPQTDPDPQETGNL